MDFIGKKVLVMGLGIQGGGVGVARFFVEHGAKVTVTDLKTKKQLAPSLAGLADLPITYVLGKHREEDFKKADLVIRNPDVPQNSPYLAMARKQGIPVEMDESLFLKLCSNRENIIGVTGTRGKTTTTHLIGTILKKAGFHTLLGGNLRGVATLSLLDQMRPNSKVVLELSSWQLQGLDEDQISPHIAVITNIYPDHLNRYQNMEEYIVDKKIIFKYQNKDDFLVLNKENGIVGSFAKEARSKIVWFSKDDTIHLGGVMASPPKADQPATIRGVIGFKLKGEHNLENLAAAYQVAKIFNISDGIIQKAVAEFTGVEFRLQEIAKIGGVTYVNDTTSTTPEATIAALQAYEGRPIILIAGGASKNLDLTKMTDEIGKRVKAVVLLEGTATDEIAAKIKQEPGIVGRYDNFRKAVLAAKNVAKPGDIVLLSPACASFGMFKNEFDRGEQFNEIIASF